MTTVKCLVFIVWHLLIYQKDIYIVHYSRAVPVQRFSERNSAVDVKVIQTILLCSLAEVIATNILWSSSQID